MGFGKSFKKLAGKGAFGILPQKTIGWTPASKPQQFSGQLTYGGQDSQGTALGSVSFGPNLNYAGGNSFEDIEGLIKARTPAALALIGSGVDEQVNFARKALDERVGALSPYAGTEALDEQNALLGLMGGQAQADAISNIPTSRYEQQQMERAGEGLSRQAFAGGDVSGAAQEDFARMGADMQMSRIQQRLDDLSPLVAISRGARSAQSAAEESALSRIADLQAGKGVQMANIRMGAAAPMMSAIQDRATLSGLQGVSKANQRAQNMNQLAQLAGMFA